MQIEVFDDMIVIHSPDNSENNKFRGLLGFKENKYMYEFIKEFELAYGYLYFDSNDVNIIYNEKIDA